MMDLTMRRKKYRGILEGDECVHPASVFDPISARIAEDLGFEVGMLAGSVASATVLGAPDLIILTLSELAQQAYRICRSGNLSLMVDADHGYGNALSVKRTVEELEAAGVAALTIEDTLLPQSFGNVKSQQLVTIEEGVGKMKAALAGRQDPTLCILGRTSAISVDGLEETLRRAKAYQDTGIDGLFFVGVKTKEEVRAIHAEVELPWILGSASEELNEKEFLSANGVRLALQGHVPFQAAVKATYLILKRLREGASASEMASIAASGHLIAQLTRESDYMTWLEEFLE